MDVKVLKIKIVCFRLNSGGIDIMLVNYVYLYFLFVYGDCNDFLIEKKE